MKKLTIFMALLLIATFANAQNKPKYVFFFIGDGMGLGHVNVAQQAFADRDGHTEESQLAFAQFPYIGIATTYSLTGKVTDSAAAGTALATGNKTSNGTIGMDASHSQNFESMAVAAKNAGKKVGIMTTVSIDHATPAAFYAHQPSRNDYKEMAEWLPKSQFDLFAGSGLKQISDNYYDSIQKNDGYKVVRGRKAKLKGDKVVWVETPENSVSNLALAIDRQDDDMRLDEMVDKAIKFLYTGKGKKEGFFIMAEGGQIDWAAHDNDAASIVHEVKDLSNAVEVAMEFYKKHADETLIVVTADHETGGLTIGYNDGESKTPLKKLFNQKGSKSVVGEKAMREMNKEAGVAFSTGGHSGVSVPIYAIGVGAEQFSKMMDNTDISKKLIEIVK